MDDVKQVASSDVDMSRLTASIKALEQGQSQQRDEILALRKQNQELEKKAKQRAKTANFVEGLDADDPDARDPVKLAQKREEESRRAFLEGERPETEFFSTKPRYFFVVFPDKRIKNEMTGLEDRKPSFIMQFEPWTGIGAELRDEKDKPIYQYGHIDLAMHDEILSGEYEIKDVLAVIRDRLHRDPQVSDILLPGSKFQALLAVKYGMLKSAMEADQRNAEILSSMAPGAHKGGHFGPALAGRKG